MRTLHSDHLIAILRMMLGTVLVMDGMSFVLSENDSFGNLYIEAVTKMILGMMIFMGMFVRLFGVSTSIALIVFAFLNPEGVTSIQGEYYGLVLLTFAMSISGAGAWSMDSMMLKKRTELVALKDLYFGFLRFSVIMLLFSEIFLYVKLVEAGEGIEIAWIMFILVVVLALLLLIGIAARYVMMLVLAFLLTDTLIGSIGFFVLEELILKLTFSLAALIYILLGPDKTTFFKDFSLSKKP